MDRKRVYESIDSERDYQDERWSSERHARNKGSLNRTVDEFSLYIQNYANKLGEVASSTDDDSEKLEVIRKIGALCVACGEAHSLPPRNGKDFNKLYDG